MGRWASGWKGDFPFFRIGTTSDPDQESGVAPLLTHTLMDWAIECDSQGSSSGQYMWGHASGAADLGLNPRMMRQLCWRGPLVGLDELRCVTVNIVPVESMVVSGLRCKVVEPMCSPDQCQFFALSRDGAILLEKGNSGPFG
eukprot:6476394-Amphidinium_carterae.1